ncbi:unnamed protein product, partial [Polarella glacialis]
MDANEAASDHADAVDQPFAYVVSLGSRCVVARFLRDQGLRNFAGPFDWVYSSAAMIRHCLKEDLKTFLDPDCIVPAGKAVGHSFYGKMLGRRVVFPHHKPDEEEDRNHFLRSAKRLRQVLASPERKLFVLAHLVKSRKDLERLKAEEGPQKGSPPESSGVLELERLFQDLKQLSVENFELLAVHIVESSAQRGSAQMPSLGPPRLLRDSGPGRERLLVHEMHCRGDCTGIYFKVEEDESALRSIIVGTGNARRRFNLLPDPLPPHRGCPDGRRKKKMGDVPPAGSDRASAGGGGSSGSRTSFKAKFKSLVANAEAEPQIANAASGNQAAEVLSKVRRRIVSKRPMEPSDGGNDLETSMRPKRQQLAHEVEAPVFVEDSLDPLDSSEAVGEDASDDDRVLRQIAELGQDGEVDIELELEQLAADSEEALQLAVASARAEAVSAASSLSPFDGALRMALEASVVDFEADARRRREADLGQRALDALGVRNGSNGFVAPVVPGTSPPAAAADDLTLQRRGQLMQLGFSSQKSEEAARRCSTVEACVEWI